MNDNSVCYGTRLYEMLIKVKSHEMDFFLVFVKYTHSFTYNVKLSFCKQDDGRAYPW